MEYTVLSEPFEGTENGDLEDLKVSKSLGRRVPREIKLLKEMA